MECAQVDATGDAGMYIMECAPLFFFFTLVTGPRRSFSLKLSDTRVYAPHEHGVCAGGRDQRRGDVRAPQLTIKWPRLTIKSTFDHHGVCAGGRDQRRGDVRAPQGPQTPNPIVWLAAEV